MWAVVYVAQSEEEANKIKSALEKEGLLVKVHEIGRKKSNSKGLLEILVPQAELDDASMILTSITY